MPRSRLAVALATALIALCPVSPGAETVDRLDPAPEWRHVEDMQALIVVLEDWLDPRAEWPRRTEAPRIRLVSVWEAVARQGAASVFRQGRLRGLYDPDRSEILLVRPWDARDAVDVSVLLHEVVHHRQASHHW